MDPVSPLRVRAARPADVESLAGLRLENARVHVALDANVYRMPERGAVTRYFTEAVGDTSRQFLAVAEVSGRVVGMVEVVPSADPPEHQILLPTKTAHVHCVVLSKHRHRGIGAALLAAAEQWARSQTVQHLVAGIHADNKPARSFYQRHGYQPNGDVRLKDVSGEAA